MLFQGQVNSTLPLTRATANTNVYQSAIGEMGVTWILPKYSQLVQSGQVMVAYGAITTPVAYTATVGIGGPLLWNGTQTKSAHILAVGYGVTVVSSTAISLGITGNTGQFSAPTNTSAISAVGNCLIGGPGPAVNSYCIGTVANGGSRFSPFADIHTGIIAADTAGVQWIDLGGTCVVPPNSWGAVASSAQTTAIPVYGIGLVWAELPV